MCYGLGVLPGARAILLGLTMGLLLGSSFFLSVPLSQNHRPLAAEFILLCWAVVLLMPTDSANPETTFRAALGRLDPARRLKLWALLTSASLA